MLTLTDERRAFLSAIGRKGGLVRAQSFSIEYQRAARAHVSHESNVANGRKGGIAYIQKYGAGKLVEQARQYRLAHPSDLEQIVTDALTLIGEADHEREGYLFPKSRCHLNTGDFVWRDGKRVVYADGAAWRDGKRVVYADGAAWHNGKDLHPSLAECSDRHARDERFDAYLRYRGWRVLRLSESEIKAHARGEDGGAMVNQLREFLGELWHASREHAEVTP